MKEKLIKERDRVVDMLPTLDPTTESYDRALVVVIRLDGIIEDLDAQFFKRCEPPKATFEVVKGAAKPVSILEPVAEPVQPTVVEEPEPAKEEPTKPEPTETVYDLATVRALLQEASGKGVQIQPIMAGFIPAGKPKKLSSIPASSYPELVEAIKNAQ